MGDIADGWGVHSNSMNISENGVAPMDKLILIPCPFLDRLALSVSWSYYSHNNVMGRAQIVLGMQIRLTFDYINPHTNMQGPRGPRNPPSHKL